MSDRRLVLASLSPRRRELLSDLDVPFEIQAPTFEEKIRPGASTRRATLDNATGKALSVAEKTPGALVIGADTLVRCGRRSLGKPESVESAFEMLSLLSGREHSVYTGVCVVDSESKRVATACERTVVRFRPLTPGEIHAYIEMACPLDRAGAYSIECKGSMLVREIRGCYFNVVGLPLLRLHDLLTQFGVHLFPNAG